MNTSILIDSLIKNHSMHSRESNFYKEHEESLRQMLEMSDFNDGKSGKDSIMPFALDIFSDNFHLRKLGLIAINEILAFGSFL